MKKNGFTIIELLIVIAIIGTVSVIGITSFRGVQEKGRDQARKRDLINLSLALQTYHERFGKYIPGEGNCISDIAVFYNSTTGIAPYMSDNKVPQDPLDENYCYISDATGLNYTLCAKLEDTNDPSIASPACGSEGYNYALTSQTIVETADPILDAGPGREIDLPGIGDLDLNEDETLRVFVTSATFTGDLGGLSRADQKCQAAADSTGSFAPQGKLWRAWLSDSNINAKDRINDGKYVRIDGVTIANNKTDLLDGGIAAPINLTENNQSPSIEINPQVGALEQYPYVWTGTQGNGDKKINENCGNWQPQSFDGGFGVVRGSASQGNEWSYFNVGGSQCQNFRKHLYCFQQPTPQSNPSPGCIESYQDFDNDSFTTGPAKYFCGISTIPYGYRSSASSVNDCYDMNPDVKPGQTQYFPNDRGDGSFDYDCNGNTTPEYSKIGRSCATYSVSFDSSCTSTSSYYACYTAYGVDTSANDCGEINNYTSSSSTVYQADAESNSCTLTLSSRFNGKLACK